MIKTLLSHSFRDNKSVRGFSLVELLTVLTIISILTALAIPAFTMGDADNISNASYTISGTLQRARAYAMGHNTYVWIGFYEEAADGSTPLPNTFPYTGKGRVIIGMVASIDGTQIVPDGASSALQASSLMQIDKLTKLQNVHITDLGLPSGSTGIAARPKGAYYNATNNSYSTTQLYGINSDNATEQSTTPFSIGSYTFYKTVRFSPSGEASIDGVSTLRRVAEIDLQPTHGTTLNSASPNVVAIQFTGIGGGLQTYRN